jgi:hypothetical protein
MIHDVTESTGRMSESDLQRFSGVCRLQVKDTGGFLLLAITTHRGLSVSKSLVTLHKKYSVSTKSTRGFEKLCIM